MSEKMFKNMQLLDLNEGKILENAVIDINGEFITIAGVLNCQPKDSQFLQKQLGIGRQLKTPLFESTHTKLIPILEKTGAELFGDRYVLFKDKAKINTRQELPKEKGETFNKIRYGKILLIEILKEYSLLLKGQPNKFEEFCELVG